MKVLKSVFCLLFLISSVSFGQIDSLKIQTKKKGVKPYIIPTALFASGLASWKYGFDKSVRRYRNDKFSDFSNKIDDQVQFVPLGLAYALPAFGLEAKNDIWNRSVLSAKSVVFMMVMTHSMKRILDRNRPTTAPYAFPSGHTAFAFMGAEILHQEYKDSKPWLSYVAYGLASQVAVFRVLNDQHWFGDVLAGAAVGIASSKLAYLTHQFRWTKWFGLKNDNISIVPDFYNKGLYISLKF